MKLTLKEEKTDKDRQKRICIKRDLKAKNKQGLNRPGN